MQDLAVSEENNGLGASEVRRVVLSLLRAFHDRMLRHGQLHQRQSIGHVLSDWPSETLDELPFDEATLGLDSLGVLDFVSEVNRFFDLSRTGAEDYLVVRRTLGAWIEVIQWHLAQVGTDAEIIFATSGSTGSPKQIRQAFSTLQSEVCAMAAGPLSRLPPSARVLCQVPVHHIYGCLWGLLLPNATCRQAVDLPAGFASATLREARTGDLIVATPHGWQAMLRDGRRLPDGVIGLSSGGPLEPALWPSLFADLGLSRLIELYGSSETGGIGWRDEADGVYHLMPDLVRQEGGLWRQAVGPLPLQDHLAWEGAERFAVSGRLDGAVQVAGVNVYPDRVADMLCACPGVREAVVRLEKDRLKAFVVPDGSKSNGDLEADLRESMAACPTVEQPARYDFGTALPRNEMGKLSDW